MDLKQIEYFIRVAELGSFTRASIDLDVAQSALSRHVRLLETELRQNLLIRNGRGVIPTEAGKILLEHGRGVLHQIERLREELARERGFAQPERVIHLAREATGDTAPEPAPFLRSPTIKKVGHPIMPIMR